MSTRINLCSGQRPFETGWTNVDVQERWKPDVVADGANMPMFADGSAEYIVIHHGLEHFGCGEADAMLRECYRILQPQGRLLVFVPDWRTLAQRWLTHQIDDYIYAVNLYGAYMNDEADRHKWIVTFDTLSKSLRSVGEWSEIKHFDWRKIGGADIAGPDWWIAGYEAVK